MKRSRMKRKRRDLCPSPLLDEAPKRTKVHAQRKFAQGSNVNSPVITPVKEFERADRSSLDLTPEPVELLPIGRPNTEDFLTFLCFRGTPLLPPNLNFFNTASIVDTNGQVHEIKSESPKNGPIDTSAITKGGCGPSDRPFIAFGVRKRADPIVISRQMEKKRRHALALQALRRKYQEQKMAKIRAVTISKLSEKPSSRATVRSNSISKVERVQQTLTAKPAVQKNKVKIISSKHINVTSQSVRTISSKIKPKMCLRSFRGRFVQQELPFRAVKKHKVPEKKILIKKAVKKNEGKKHVSTLSSNKIEPFLAEKKINIVSKHKVSKDKNQDVAVRVTRSNKVPIKSKHKGKQIIKRRILMSSSSALVKSRVLRSQTIKTANTSQSRLTRRCLNRSGPSSIVIEKLPKKIYKKIMPEPFKKEFKLEDKVKANLKMHEEMNKEMKSPKNVKKVEKVLSSDHLKAEPGKISRTSDRVLRNDAAGNLKDVSERKLEKSKESKQVSSDSIKKEAAKTIYKVEQKSDNRKDRKDVDKNKLMEDKKDLGKIKVIPTLHDKIEIEKKPTIKKSNIIRKPADSRLNEFQKVKEKKDAKLSQVDSLEQIDVKEMKLSQRPTRKTKEAAAIYMEILSHKLVNEKKTDDDNVSIDSFPELPNVKRTEQRENELKAKAKISKNEKNKEKLVKEEIDVIEKEIDLKKYKIEIIGINETDPQPDLDLKKKSSVAKCNTKVDIKSTLPEIGSDNLQETKTKCDKENYGNKNKTKNVDSIQNISNNDQIDAKKIKLELDNVKIKKEIKTEIAEKNQKEPCEKGGKELIKDIKMELRENVAKDKIDETVPIIITLGMKEKDMEQKQDVMVTGETKTKELVSEKITDTVTDNSQTLSNIANEKVVIITRNEKEVKQKSIPKIISSDSHSPGSDENSTKTSKIQSLQTKKDHKKSKTLQHIQGREKVVATEIQNKPTLSNPKSLDSDDECLANLSKARDSKAKENLEHKEECVSKRQTRHNSQKNKIELVDSEDSFHLDVKIPRKKQITRSRCSKVSATSSRAKSLIKFNRSSSHEESNDSTISSKSNAKTEVNSNKKFSGTKIGIKVDVDFSDSDEEPLSKLTVNRKGEEKSAEELKEDILRKQKALIESPPHKNKVRKISKHKEVKDANYIEVNKDNMNKEASTSKNKPKRECAKRPSNYLPMFSSSDDEEKYFHGFSLKTEKKNESIYSHSSLDFLSKGLRRRFGKEKVNMSNEQIEKWLKDSALAGDDDKKEEELKLCQEIPTETSLNTNTMIDTKKLKSSLLKKQEVTKKEKTPEKKISSSQEDAKYSSIYKSPGDRKPIFKKEKIKTAPTVGAFSVNNESSIYAFEEEIEDMVSTPFRRPTRRPSSTATSKSEEELLKTEEQTKFGQFRKPILKNEVPKIDEHKLKMKDLESIAKPSQPTSYQKIVHKATAIRNIIGKTLKRNNSEQMDDVKYKIPSSPSASSSSSAKLYKRQFKQKVKPVETCNPIRMTDFPCNGPGELVEAPTFYPTEKEFQDPLEYIEKIGVRAEQFGICRIVPPSTFKPECKVSDDMRFTSYNQYVHKMLHRWGPNFKELMAIKKYLYTQNINLTQPPWIGGMEVDLPRLYQTVQSLGGLKEVIEKEKWSKVSDIMRIPKSAQDRVTKLDDIYCKYLLPYDTLSPDEREKLLDEVETEWAKRESKILIKMQKSNIEHENESDSESDTEVEECITKGRNMALNAFYRIARNTMSMWFRNSEPTAQEIEQEFWKHVSLRRSHICVHSGSIDSGSWGYGFAVSKNSPFARHAWNLKVLTNNSGSVLRSLGPVIGVTVPTLHVGMVFSACCWYRDPHSLPWIEYLHTGGSKIWYGIPNSVGDLFQKALTKLVPNYCRNQGIWLPSDTVMLPPSLLIESGVSLSRTVQEPGQFIVVFPKAFTSSISTSYVVSESVFFAPPSWLKTAQMTFDLLRSSCEPSMFSLDRLYLSIINDQRTSVDVLKQMIPIISMLSSKEKIKRENIRTLEVTNFEVLPPPETHNAKRRKKTQEGGDYECEICRMNLFISMVVEQQEDAIYCLDHAIERIEKKKILPENCKLLYTYSEYDLDSLVDKINVLIEQKMQKKVFNKFSGMPTLLNKQN